MLLPRWVLRWLRGWVLGCALVCGLSVAAHAEVVKVALLPLDAPGKLAIYGQAVAAEVARTLGGPELEIVVVAAHKAVPLDAVLIVEGSLSSARKRVTVELRLRTLQSRTPLVTVTAAERSLAALDRAAIEVSRKLLPRMQEELARRKSSPTPDGPAGPAGPGEPGGNGGPKGPTGSDGPPGSPETTPPAPVAPAPPAIIAVAMRGGVTGQEQEGFLAQLAEAGSALTRARWQPARVELPEVSPAALLGSIAPSPGAVGVAFIVRDLQVSSGSAGSAFVGKVSARVIVTHGRRVAFDRVLKTDTVVGRRKADRAQLQALLAREVVEILRPHFVALVGTSAAGDGAHAAR